MESIIGTLLRNILAGGFWYMRKAENRAEKEFTEQMIRRMVNLGKYNPEHVSNLTGIPQNKIEEIATGKKSKKLPRFVKFKLKGKISKWHYRRIFSDELR